MNGQQSQLYEYFQILMIRGFLEIRKHTQAIVQLIETMMEKSNFPCFKNFNLEVFRGRFKEGQDGK
jgi:phosphatidylinositol 4-kinase